MKQMRKLFALAALAAIVLLTFVQFGPPVFFGAKPAETTPARAGTR
jgi:hypothetical protein